MPFRPTPDSANRASTEPDEAPASQVKARSARPADTIRRTDATQSRPFGIWNFGICDFFGIWDFGIWNLLGRAITRTAITFLVFAILPTFALSQTPPELVVIVDQTPIVIDSPPPFLEVSRNLPDLYAKNARALPPTHRLLAWFIPDLSLKELLNELPAPPRYRALQIQTLKEMEPVRYDAKTLATLRAQTLATHPMPQITEAGADTLFNVLNLTTLAQEAGGQKILGMAGLGENTFTLCVAASAEGSDRRGGREIETTVSCVTYMLIKEKIILLAVTGPELTAKELRNTMRLSREWITLLRERNPK